MAEKARSKTWWPIYQRRPQKWRDPVANHSSTQISPFLPSLLFFISFFFFRRPSCQRSRFHGAHLLQNVSLRSRLFPGGHERQTTYSCKLMISGWIPCSCRVDYSDKRRVCDQLSRSHRAGIKKKERKKEKYVWVGEGCVCLLWLCCSKWWCTQTCMISPMTGVGGLRSAFFRFIPAPSLSLSQTSGNVHISSRRWQTACGALSPSSLSRRHLWLLLCIAPRTNTLSGLYTERTENTCRPRCFFSAFVTVVSTHNSTPVETAVRWYSCVCVCACVCGTERERGFPLHQKLPELLLKT